MSVNLPENGVSSHQTLVVPGKGIPRTDRLNSGDHFVRVGIQVPKKLSHRQRELIRHFSILEPPVENGVVSYYFIYCFYNYSNDDICY